MSSAVPAITCALNITATDINGNSVASHFTDVKKITLDYFKGIMTVLDATGEFWFTLRTVTTYTTTIAGTVTTVTVS